MYKFLGEPHLLVNVKPPIGNIKHIRFDANGEFITDNERIINRMHHVFDGVPAMDCELTPDVGDDLELQLSFEPVKRYQCNKCDFNHENKGVLLQHKKTEHPKE